MFWLDYPVLLTLKNMIVFFFCFNLTLTRAPITPRLVNLKYSNGLVSFTVPKNG